MGRLTKVIQIWLNENGWEEKPDIDNENNTSSTSFSYQLDDYVLRGYLDANEDQEYVQVFMYYDDTEIPEERMEEVRNLIEILNLGSRFGSLHIIHESNVIRYYIAMDVGNATFEPQHITNMFAGGLSKMDFAIPRYMAVCFSGISAEKAMELDG